MPIRNPDALKKSPMESSGPQGLLNESMARPANATSPPRSAGSVSPQSAGPRLQPAYPEGLTQADEAEQEEFSQIVDVIKLMAHDERTRDNVVKMLQATPDLADSAGRTAAQLVIMADQNLDWDIPEDMVLSALQEALTVVDEITTASGLGDLEEDELQRAYMTATGELTGVYGADDDDLAEASEAIGRNNVEMIAKQVGVQ